LKSRGIETAIATSKAEAPAISIAKHFKLDKYFDVIAGSSPDGTRSHKSEVIAHALSKSRSNQNTIFMIGDRKYDIIGAKELSLTSVGVLWGYGSREELNEAGADHIIETPANLLDIL